MSKFILEIGSEEIPAGYLQPAADQLKSDMEELLESKRVEYKSVSVYYTVRRLTVVADGISDKQKDLAYEKKGPRYDIGFKDNSLTVVGKKFLESNKASEKDIKIKEEKGQKFIYLDIFEKGLKTVDVLSAALPGVIKSIRFPKSMVWDDSGVTFARPVRWILCLLDREPVIFSFGRVISGGLTRLHKFVHENKEISVKDADDYFDKMEKNGIIMNQEERKKQILDKISALLVKEKFRLMEDRELLDVLASSVETVTVMAGRFDEKYLFLPKEVIITAMREHQRYFAVLDENGGLTNYFVNVRDGGTQNNEFIAKQHAKALYSRLNDAGFFYKEDLKVPLEKNNEKLKEAIFITGLGTMYEKVERLKTMASRSKEIFGYEDTASLQEIANLSKADLMTNMVGEKEYVGLRGFMGGVYLEKQGRPEKIWKAVGEHYLPNMAGDKMPSTTEGILLSLIDKMDNMVGFYIAGFKPTGSKDPYAVRRQALNIIYVALEKGLDIDLAFFVYENSMAYKKQMNRDTDTGEIVEFLRLREINYFKDKALDYDIINSIASGAGLNVLDDFSRASMLMNKRRSADGFNDIIFAISRVANILPPKFTPSKVDTGLFELDEERALYSKFTSEKGSIEKMIASRQYQQAFDAISDFKAVIGAYFAKVTVMAQNPDIQKNRLSTLSDIKNVFYRLADFSKIVVDRK